MTTSKVNPDEPRKPTTLFEYFRVDPRGAASFPEWINDRIWELLQRPAIMQTGHFGVWTGRAFDNVFGCIETAVAFVPRTDANVRVVLIDGTIIKEWLPETKDSANVEKT
jgi:hypothetical protein